MDAKHSTTHWREEQKHSYSRLRFQMTRIILSFIMSVVFPQLKIYLSHILDVKQLRQQGTGN